MRLHYCAGTICMKRMKRMKSKERTKRRLKVRDTYTDALGICLCCARSPVDKHHVQSRGSGGTDEIHNLMPLCREHHDMVHKEGLSHLIWRFPQVEQWLLSKGWYQCLVSNKWLH